jgi:hypothetical protein
MSVGEIKIVDGFDPDKPDFGPIYDDIWSD